MAQYSARFIDNYATITEPLRALTKQDSEWHWTKEQEDVFERVEAHSQRTQHLHTSIPKCTQKLMSMPVQLELPES